MRNYLQENFTKKTKLICLVWAEENPEIYKIIKKNNLDEKGFTVSSLTMMNFNKETAMIFSQEHIMKFFDIVGF